MSDAPNKSWLGWFTSKHRPLPSIPFEVSCRCGYVLRGSRFAKHQVLPCPACRQSVFILARSPYPETQRSIQQSMQPIDPQPKILLFLKTWKLPLIAGATTLASLLLLFWFLLPVIAPSSPAKIKRHIESGYRAIEEGSFHRALDELQAAARERARSPRILSIEENRRLDELLRQAELLDRLISEPLGEILRQAAATRPDEWRRHFERHYLGRTVLFDGELRLDRKGQPELPFHKVEAGSESARVAIEDLQLLKRLPLSENQRMIFGAQLIWLGRDEAGNWVVRFEPESGVLVTDANVLASWRPSLLDAATHAVLKRQAGWMKK